MPGGRSRSIRTDCERGRHCIQHQRRPIMPQNGDDTTVSPKHQQQHQRQHHVVISTVKAARQEEEEEEHEDEPPPFALDDVHPPHQSGTLPATVKVTKHSDTTSATTNLLARPSLLFGSHKKNGNVSSPPAAPPGLVESIMTDGTQSAQSTASSSTSGLDSIPPPTSSSRSMTNPAVQSTRTAHDLPAAGLSSTFLMSSLHTIHSDAGDISLTPSSHSQLSSTSSVPPHSSSSYQPSPSPLFPTTSTSTTVKRAPMNTSTTSAASIGFSQLLQAADDSNDGSPHHVVSPPRLPPVSEKRQGADRQLPPKATRTTTCSTAGAFSSFNRRENRDNNDLGTPLLMASTATIIPANDDTPIFGNRSTTTTTTPITRLLSNNGNNPQVQTALDRVKASVRACLDDDESFEVSMLLDAPCSVEDVMRIVGNPDLLRLWCDPVETLIVTSSSEGLPSSSPSPTSSTHVMDTRTRDESPSVANNNDADREYDGEWIEATTTALDSPPSGVGFFYRAGQRLLESLGFASYGRITMFVERRRGHMGLTIGPFHGGIHAAHTIRVHQDDGDETRNGRVRVVDRVRLTRGDGEDAQLSLNSFFGCCALESCLNQCVLPSVEGYVDQVRTSMARLRLLVESGAMIDVDRTTSILVVHAR